MGVDTHYVKHSAIGGGITESPCASCDHHKEDKNICRTYDDCPIKLPSVLPPGTYDKTHTHTQKNNIPKKQCPMPGCTNTIRETSRVCQKCWPKINHRIRKGVPPAYLYVDFKLPNNWKEMWGTHQYKNRNTIK